MTDAVLLLHVIDASSPQGEEHVAHVMEVLAEIGAATIAQLLVLNQIDLIAEAVVPQAVLGRLLERSGQGGSAAWSGTESRRGLCSNRRGPGTVAGRDR